MDAERWRKIEQLYHDALERKADERAAFLQQACAGDQELGREVEALLAREKQAENFLESPVLEIAAKALAQDLPSPTDPPDEPERLVGQTVSHYRVLGKVGSGAMGVVYRARDTKLGRDVALKILPPAFAADSERMDRFKREAKVLASLNHPNIAAIYGLEDAGGTPALIMELVEGPTLGERARQGPVPLDEVLQIGRQTAEALEAAHERAIIHRDLKPENIKITPEGKVKVLDFGLAKAMEAAGATPEDLSKSATVNGAETKAGAILGTAGYMSPEQVRGKPVDKRTDIWAFGCVLYELLAGRRAFPGATLSDYIAAVLSKEPAWQVLPEGTPPRLRALVKRCLVKDPQHRLRDIGDARLELEDLLAGPAEEVATPKPTGVTRRTAIGTLAGAAAGAAVGGVLGSKLWRGATARSLTQFRIPLPEGAFARASYNKRVAISPDGTHIAFNVISGGEDKFYVHPLRQLEPKLFPAPAVGIAFFSPDGQWIGFLAPGTPVAQQLRKVALDGAAPATVYDQVEVYWGGTWAADDVIYCVAGIPGGLLRVPAAGGQPTEILKIDLAKNERQYKYPCALPGGKAVLLTLATADSETFDDAHIAAVNTETGQIKTLVEGGTAPRYSPSGHLLYARDGKVFAIRLDAKRLETMGQPFPVLEGVLMSRNSGAANYDVSASGDLVYIPGATDKGERTLVWVDRNGHAEPLKLPPRAYLHPRISPDMRQLAIEIEGATHNFYVYDFAREVLSQITTDGLSHWPVWSPDGTELVYRSGPMMAWRMWQVPADRSRPAAQLPGVGLSQNAESWSADGHALAYTTVTAEVGSHIMVESLVGDHASRPFVDVKAAAGSPKFSPDGRWLAYCSNETKKAQVYVQAFPGPGAKIQVSSDGGTDPVWKRSGDELYFRNGDKMMAVAISTVPTFTAGRPRMLWEGHYSHGMSTSCGPPGPTSSNYDVTADGKRFLMVKDEAPDTAVSKQIVVVLGWADEVTRIEKSKTSQT
jgi:serine/threonine-protein kinase